MHLPYDFEHPAPLPQNRPQTLLPEYLMIGHTGRSVPLIIAELILTGKAKRRGKKAACPVGQFHFFWYVPQAAGNSRG
jgi:hypothetical protein